jgi:GT2 family glycosyltransferase
MPHCESGVVAVVIPTHNRRESLLACLNEVHSLEEVACCCVVVFDGCTDGSQEAVRKNYPRVLHVEGDGSLWWSGAINKGIAAARELGSRYFCLLNDDVRPDPGMLAALMRSARECPGALIGSMIHRMDDPSRLWCAGGFTDWWGSGIGMRADRSADLTAERPVLPVHWLPGMGTLIPNSVIERIGMMDADGFPQYFGDADFCLRARQAGIPVLLCPEARLYNDVSSTGELLPQGAIDWKRAVSILCSLRSHANWRIRWRFWLRHCPPFLVLWQALRFYLPLLAAMAKKLTWDRLTQSLPRAEQLSP